MKLAFASAALLGLTLAPAAYAQVTCSEVSRLLSEVESDFENISGEEIDDYLFEATFSISGAYDCQVDLDWDSVYFCEWQYTSYSAAAAAMSSHAAALGYCLSGWKSGSMTADTAADEEGYRTLGGTFWAGTGAYEDMEWDVELEEHTDSNGTHYHVWIGLIYYL
jgi:hypothetical protein